MVAEPCLQNEGAKFNAAMMAQEAKDCFVLGAQCKMKAKKPGGALTPSKTPPYEPPSDLFAAPFFAAKLLESACLCVEREIDEVRAIPLPHHALVAAPPSSLL